jgi:hypothetical protein
MDLSFQLLTSTIICQEYFPKLWEMQVKCFATILVFLKFQEINNRLLEQFC